MLCTNCSYKNFLPLAHAPAHLVKHLIEIVYFLNFKAIPMKALLRPYRRIDLISLYKMFSINSWPVDSVEAANKAGLQHCGAQVSFTGNKQFHFIFHFQILF